jgi:MoaE-MoaD fusion protein
MQIRVLFFGVLKDLSGRATETLDLPERSTLADLLNHCAATAPELEQHLPGIAMSINHEFARASDILKTGDEVALLPPVSGGSDASTRGPHCALIRDPIDAAAIANVVRNNTRGRQTLYLEYESYETMALNKMEELAIQALAEFKIRDVKLVHRLGRLEIGETSVLIVVASAHRGPAFDACRWLIDTLKRTVPIWKKEYFIDGAVWADGEPFPPEIATQPAAASPEPQAAQSPPKASH